MFDLKISSGVFGALVGSTVDVAVAVVVAVAVGFCVSVAVGVGVKSITGVTSVGGVIGATITVVVMGWGLLQLVINKQININTNLLAIYPPLNV